MKKIIFTLIIFAVVLFGCYFLFFKKESISINSNSTESTTTASELNSTTSEMINLGGAQYQLIENVVSTSTISRLNLSVLSKKLEFPQNNPLEINKRYEADINKIVKVLKEKPENFDKWIELGVYLKNINDYAGAIDAWTNATILQPKSALPESNIGNILGYYMKDSINAEKHYLKSIEIEPNVGFWYYQTFLFYKEVVKDEVRAKAIIEKGVVNNPGDIELKEILKNL